MFISNFIALILVQYLIVQTNPVFAKSCHLSKVDLIFFFLKEDIIYYWDTVFLVPCIPISTSFGIDEEFEFDTDSKVRKYLVS